MSGSELRDGEVEAMPESVERGSSGFSSKNVMPVRVDLDRVVSAADQLEVAHVVDREQRGSPAPAARPKSSVSAKRLSPATTTRSSSRPCR